jgi:FAD/FMN-containing dehydrogenase
LTGLALGGGYGLLGGAYGLAADNIVDARVVLADGRLVSASEDPDLLWGLRGGGGNLGVVTSLRYRLHRPGTLLGGLILFGMSEAAAVLRGYQEVLADAPDGLTVMAGFFCGADGEPVLFLLPAWVGEPAEGRRHIARLRALGTPAFEQVAPLRFLELLSLFDQQVVDGRHNDMETRWLPALTGETIGELVEAVSGITSPYSAVFLHHFHGAAARVPVADTPFALRRDHLLVEIVAAWPADAPPAQAVRHRAWGAGLSARLAPHSLPGGYPNLLRAGDYERAVLAYGPNAARLLATKRRLDPDGVFDAVPTLIPPSVTADPAVGPPVS